MFVNRLFGWRLLGSGNSTNHELENNMQFQKDLFHFCFELEPECEDPVEPLRLERDKEGKNHDQLNDLVQEHKQI